MNRLLLAAMALLLLPPAARAAGWDDLFTDEAVYTIHQGTKAVGTEIVSFERHGDSLLVFSHSRQGLPRPEGVDSLEKHVAVALSRADLELKGYESVQTLNGFRIKRRLSIHETTFTAYFETTERGEGKTKERPPGRLFVIDPQAFVLFDVVFRSLSQSSFEERPVNLLFLGVEDTVLVVRAKRLGTETIRWGSRPVQAQKMSLSDDRTEFLAWLSPEGRMLRLEQPTVRLRVERKPPAVKPARRRPGG